MYAAPGTYTARLTVTDGAGSSLAQVFTGQTVSLQGGPQASTTSTVTSPAGTEPVAGTERVADAGCSRAETDSRSPSPTRPGARATGSPRSQGAPASGPRWARRSRSCSTSSARVALAFTPAGGWAQACSGSCVAPDRARTAGNPRAGGRWHAARWRSADTPASTPLASKAAFLPHRSSSPVATHCRSARPTPPADARARVGLASRSSRRRAHEARAAAGANPREALYALDNRRPTAQQSLIARNVRVLHWRDLRVPRWIP